MERRKVRDDRLKGKVIVESQPGHGTKFQLVVP